MAGAQLKIAHNLESTDAITHQELSQLLTGALEASSIEAGEEKVKEMVAGIMRVSWGRVVEREAGGGSWAARVRREGWLLLCLSPGRERGGRCPATDKSHPTASQARPEPQ